MFKKARRMVSVAKTFAECKDKHPEVWELGSSLADETFNTRSDYMRENTRNPEGQERYIRLAGEHLLVSLGDGSLFEDNEMEFPEPITKSSATCFGIAFSKRLQDLFDDEQ